MARPTGSPRPARVVSSRSASTDDTVAPLSPRLGAGVEFADIRPFRPGDRLRFRAIGRDEFDDIAAAVTCHTYAPRIS